MRCSLAEQSSHYLLQISDCHLMPDPARLFRGVDSDASLGSVAGDALNRGIMYEHLVLTGDLVHHGGADAYRRLLEIVSPLPGRCHWIPGNHDEHSAMREAAQLPLGRERIECGNWRILLLDSTDNPDGRGGGSLGVDQLSWLEEELAQSVDRFVLIALHHNPVSTDSLWQDRIKLGNAADFAALVADRPHVRGIICGHLHQHQTLDLGGVPVWSAPSTVIQFKPGQPDFMLEDDPVDMRGGYCVYRLWDDGRIEARLHRV